MPVFVHVAGDVEDVGDDGSHAPSASTAILSRDFARHTGHAGYLNVVYSAPPGISTSPSGFVFSPFLRRSSGFSVSSAPEARSSSRKADQVGFRADSLDWKVVRGYVE